jgi:hypothetical protein
MNRTLSGPTSNALTSKLGHLRPQAYFIISLPPYSLISLFHHRHPRCTASLMAKACTPPFTAAEWFLSFPRGELWLPSTAGVASELHSTPTHGRTHWSSTRCTSTKLVTGDGFQCWPIRSPRGSCHGS